MFCYTQEGDRSIELHYQGCEEDGLWVQELRNWLISRGIPSKYLIAVPGSGEADIVKFETLKAGDGYK